MSKKYVIEIKPEYEDTTKGVMVLGARESNLYVDALSIEDLEELNSDYINEHYGELQDEAYQKGINDGSLDVKQRVEGAYQRGLDDAWEAARKIVTWPDRSLVNSDTFDLDHGECIFTKYSASEAIAKLKAYEDKQAYRIEVGDEVVWNDGTTLTVTRVYKLDDDEWCDGIAEDGKMYGVLKNNVRKTGRHHDIQSILEAMKECSSV